ncbi:hypothetical protein PGTUg99_016901 [Puccinia graminis f. sp. tritici]|uniref:Uncharacterized protein n=1 Tax=Puccinia graminis f. sp. tritici TaxID=56615 RepID=A0A5B0NRM6_PUCGR|nr:hypothetical protein PGTUg99_016901 [Puccinia graminis f. sp. tritici]
MPGLTWPTSSIDPGIRHLLATSIGFSVHLSSGSKKNSLDCLICSRPIDHRSHKSALDPSKQPSIRGCSTNNPLEIESESSHRCHLLVVD